MSIEKGKMVCSNSSLSVSPKSSLIICRAINRKKFTDAKKILEDLVSEKQSLDGKFYTKTANEILQLLSAAEKNAVARGFEISKLQLFISSHKGAKLYRTRRKRTFGYQLKSSNVQVVLKTIEKPEKKEEKK